MRGDDDVSLTSTGFYRSYGTGTRFSFNKGSSTYETLKAQEEDGACGGFHCSQAAAPQQGANGGFALRRVFIATGVLVLLAVGVSLVKDTRAVSTSVVGSLGAGKEEVPSKISMSVKVRKLDDSRCAMPVWTVARTCPAHSAVNCLNNSILFRISDKFHMRVYVDPIQISPVDCIVSPRSSNPLTPLALLGCSTLERRFLKDEMKQQCFSIRVLSLPMSPGGCP